MKKVLFLDHIPFMGGAQISLLRHLKYLNKEGFQGELGCPAAARNSEVGEYLCRQRIKCVALPFPRLKRRNPLVPIHFFRGFRALRRLVDAQKYDLVVTNTVRTTIVGTLALGRRNIKLVWLIRDFTFPPALFKLLSVYPDRIVFNSCFVREYYRNCLKEPAKNRVVYPGRETHKEIKKVNEGGIDRVKRQLGIREKDQVIGCASRLVRWKGVHILVEAIKELRNRGHRDIRCVIMGAGKGQEYSMEEELKIKVAQENLGKNIIFLGYKKDIYKYLPCFDIFTVPSIEKEAFGAAAVDAMMAGLPVVASKSGGLEEVVQDGVTGLLVTPGDSKELAQALEELLQKENKRLAMGANGYKYAVTGFSAESTTEQLEDIYKDLIG